MFAALIVEALELARLVPGQRVMRQQRHGDGRVGVADHGVGQLGRDPPCPSSRLRWAWRRESPPVSGRASVTWRKKSWPNSLMRSTSWICGSVWSMKFFGLPPPQSTTPLLPPDAFGRQHEGGGFIDVDGRIDAQLVAAQFHARRRSCRWWSRRARKCSTARRRDRPRPAPRRPSVCSLRSHSAQYLPIR